MPCAAGRDVPVTEASTNGIEPLLRKLEGYGPLPEADKAALRALGAGAHRVAAGTDLIREGDEPSGVFLVLEGFACRYKLRATGARAIMAYLVPGDFCDLDVALLPRMDHSLATLSTCRVARVALDTTAELLQRPALARTLRMATLVDEATAREWLVNVGRRSGIERLAHLFCELHARLAVVGLTAGDSYDLPITQAELADTTGQTGVHVNRTLGELRRQGLIELGQQRLTILDMPRLRALAEFRSNYLHLGDEAAA